MLLELSGIEAKYPTLVTPSSATQVVGAPPSTAFSPYSHAVPMLSLANAFDYDDLRAFDARVRKLAGVEPTLSLIHI